MFAKLLFVWYNKDIYEDHSHRSYRVENALEGKEQS